MLPHYLVKFKKSFSTTSASDSSSYQRLKLCATVGIELILFLFVTAYLFSRLRLSVCMQVTG